MAEAAAPPVAVLLLNWRRAEETVGALEALRGSGYPELHVLVMDNGSGDGSAERMAAAIEGHPREELLAFDTNLGYCKAVNRGLERVRALDVPFVLLLNNDVLVAPGFLAPLVQLLREVDELACVGPTMLRRDGRVWCEGATLGFTPNLVRLRRQGAFPSDPSSGPRAVDFIPGACALYRRSDLDALGGLDEDYFMYQEDADLGLRLAARGRQVVWVPWVTVLHDAGTSGGGPRSALRKYLLAHNELRLLRRHGRLQHWLAFALLDVLLWPLSLLGGWRGGVAKLRGIVSGLRGGVPTAADVERMVGEPS